MQPAVTVGPASRRSFSLLPWDGVPPNGTYFAHLFSFLRTRLRQLAAKDPDKNVQKAALEQFAQSTKR
jgi:hypothetical protein